MSADRRLSRGWFAVGAVAFLAAHVVALHHVASRFALPVTAIAAVALVAVAAHTGLLARLHDRFRRRG